MWIFTKRGFFSIVEDKDDKSLLLIRARVKGDIERVWPSADVRCTPDSDYAYRASLNRDYVAEQLENEAYHIDYTNFKDSIEDDRRSDWYLGVWMTMVAMQDALMEGMNNESNPNKPKRRIRKRS